jgi:hypothetical protein
MNRLATLLATFALAALAVPAAAQGGRIAVAVPYDFMAGSRKLAAGQYTISHAVPNDPRVFAFRGAAKHQKALVVANSKTGETAAEGSELTFARYGEAYFLRSFRIHGDRNLYEVPQSPEEKDAARGGAEAVLVSLKIGPKP